MEKHSSAVIFKSDVLSCWKMHISAQLIESFPTEYCLCSCGKEKLPTPVEAHDKPWVEWNFSEFSSHLFTPVHTCSQLFTPVHPCSHLFTPQWLFTLFADWKFLLEFSCWENCYFSIFVLPCWDCILLRTKSSFSTVYGWCSRIEVKMWMPLPAYT